MPSRRRSTTSRKNKQLENEPSFLLDRSLGRYKLAEQLRPEGFTVKAGDDVYLETERDPWIFYDCGKKGMVVITADKEFMKSFPHMAAIELGNTTVLAFTSNNYNSDERGKALIKARAKVLRAIRGSGRRNFIGSIGMDGSLSIVERSPHPNRKYCDDRDWKSYERVCIAEGVKYERVVAASDPVPEALRNLLQAPPESKSHRKKQIRRRKPKASPTSRKSLQADQQLRGVGF